MSRLRLFVCIAGALAATLAAGGRALAQTTSPAAAQTAAPGASSAPGWAWPAIPGCLADPEIKTSGELDGVLYPAFLPGTEVVRFFTDRFEREFHGATGLVRVSTAAVTARSGSWWTSLATVSDGTRLIGAEAIRAKLALTGTPSCIAYASFVRNGVRGYMGVVAPAFDEPGGGLEFWFPPGAVLAGSIADLAGTPGCGGR
jgi:hypothetical protein